jgi:hypothetical protein
MLSKYTWFPKAISGRRRGCDGPWMPARFVGQRTELPDKAGGTAVIEPGVVYNVRIGCDGSGGWLWLDIEPRDELGWWRCSCPYETERAIRANWETVE